MFPIVVLNIRKFRFTRAVDRTSSLAVQVRGVACELGQMGRETGRNVGVGFYADDPGVSYVDFLSVQGANDWHIDSEAYDSRD